MSLGKVSAYTCPDCHGVLVQIEEGKVVRFRCHTGHAFSFKSLLAEINEAIDKGLWDTLARDRGAHPPAPPDGRAAAAATSGPDVAAGARPRQPRRRCG